MGTLAAVVEELRTTNALLRDLLTTTRFGRGGYDGPFLQANLRTLTPAGGVVEVFGGRGDPTALLFEFGPTLGGVTGTLYLSDDPGGIGGGFTLAIVAGNGRRIIADRHQHIYAMVDATGAVPLKVLESRL